LKQEEVGNVFCKMVHSWDYGTYAVMLDGQPLATWDLYSPAISPTSHKLDVSRLSAGQHTLRFEGKGKSALSKGYYLGFDSLAIRVPIYKRPLDGDLRKLQKTP
jgi:hypothetical protein